MESRKGRICFQFNKTASLLTSQSSSVQKYIEVATICGGTSPSGHRLRNGSHCGGIFVGRASQCLLLGFHLTWLRQLRDGYVGKSGKSEKLSKSLWMRRVFSNLYIWEGNHRKGGEVMVQ